MANPSFSWHVGDGPLVATALHHGHDLRDELQPLIRLDEPTRFREEDPLTGSWTRCAESRIVVHRSRFEVDLNRPRQRAVYVSPADAWGIDVWQEPPTAAVLARSLTQYDLFYQLLDALLSRLVALHGRVVVYDLHSYNHRREGPAGPAAAAAENPEINVGTGTMDRQYWAPVVDRFIEELRHSQLQDHPLDVRENVRFRGGWMVEWIHQRYPKTVCGIAIEVKKTFMDEWTGIYDPMLLSAIGEALTTTVGGVLDSLGDVHG